MCPEGRELSKDLLYYMYVGTGNKSIYLLAFIAAIHSFDCSLLSVRRDTFRVVVLDIIIIDEAPLLGTFSLISKTHVSSSSLNRNGTVR